MWCLAGCTGRPYCSGAVGRQAGSGNSSCGSRLRSRAWRRRPDPPGPADLPHARQSSPRVGSSCHRRRPAAREQGTLVAEIVLEAAVRALDEVPIVLIERNRGHPVQGGRLAHHAEERLLWPRQCQVRSPTASVGSTGTSAIPTRTSATHAEGAAPHSRVAFRRDWRACHPDAAASAACWTARLASSAYAIAWKMSHRLGSRRFPKTGIFRAGPEVQPAHGGPRSLARASVARTAARTRNTVRRSRCQPEPRRRAAGSTVANA